MNSFVCILISSTLFSVSTLFLKGFLTDGFNWSIFLSPLFVFFSLIQLIAFFIFQVGLKNGKTSNVQALNAGLTIIIPSLLGVFLLNELVSLFQVIAIVLVIYGSLIILSEKI